MELKVIKSGMLTSIQDLGRWGYQSSGVPVAGAMDIAALRMGNAMLDNDENAAALEVTIVGPELEVHGEGLVVFAGAELGFSVNGENVGSWNVKAVSEGDILSFCPPSGGKGCRGCLCVGGGVDVPLVMGSRSTYMRAKIGGYEGRKLFAGDTLKIGKYASSWRLIDGFALGADLRPNYSSDLPLYILPGLQQDAFTEAGLETFFSAEYILSNESDRMGCRFEGPVVEHGNVGADIVSDAIPLGAVQIPGHGMPIAMLADRQTTGGYTKIGVLTPGSIQRLVQKLPGDKVHFARATSEEAINELRDISGIVQRIKQRRLDYVSKKSQTRQDQVDMGNTFKRLIITVDGKSYNVTCEEI